MPPARAPSPASPPMAPHHGITRRPATRLSSLSTSSANLNGAKPTKRRSAPQVRWCPIRSAYPSADRALSSARRFIAPQRSSASSAPGSPISSSLPRSTSEPRPACTTTVKSTSGTIACMIPCRTSKTRPTILARSLRFSRSKTAACGSSWHPPRNTCNKTAATCRNWLAPPVWASPSC